MVADARARFAGEVDGLGDAGALSVRPHLAGTASGLAGAIMIGGYCAPFDLAACFLLGGGALIALAWGENYGTSAASRAASTDCLAPMNPMTRRQSLVRNSPRRLWSDSSRSEAAGCARFDEAERPL